MSRQRCLHTDEINHFMQNKVFINILLEPKIQILTLFFSTREPMKCSSRGRKPRLDIYSYSYTRTQSYLRLIHCLATQPGSYCNSEPACSFPLHTGVTSLTQRGKSGVRVAKENSGESEGGLRWEEERAPLQKPL